jgi:hypothetical protein
LTEDESGRERPRTNQGDEWISRIMRENLLKFAQQTDDERLFLAKFAEKNHGTQAAKDI